MARPQRIEFPGAVYHVTSQGDRGRAIFADDGDRMLFLDILGEVVEDTRWICYAYCLLTDRYHVLIETPDVNLSKGMRQLGGIYTQAANRRHGRKGPVFRGRFKAVLVDADTYLLELARDIVLSPVREGLVEDPAAWIWSSHLATAGTVRAPAWLAADRILGRLSANRNDARARYRHLVAEGTDQSSLWADRRRQIFLGDDAFVARMQSRRPVSDGDAAEAASRPSSVPTLEAIAAQSANRNEAIIAAHATGAYSYQRIAQAFGLHFTTVGRIVRAAKIKSRSRAL